VKKTAFIVLLISLISMSAVSDTRTEGEWELKLVPGEHYSCIKWYGPFPMKKRPLIAVWLEDREGNLLKTLYITGRAAENNWRGKAQERPEALPVYYHRQAASPLSGPVDSVSAASTGKTPGNRSFSEAFPAGVFRIMAEVNSSYDYNEFYTKENSGVNGQPSLVYQVEWDSSEKEFHLAPLGTGDISGCSGRIDPDLSRLTTALSLMEDIALVKKR